LLARSDQTMKILKLAASLAVLALATAAAPATTA
jgi:hypothetical protein